MAGFSKISLFATLFVATVGFSLTAHSSMTDFSTAKAGDSFKDCSNCPEMVVVPPGSFIMGDPKGREDEKPVQKVEFSEPFAIGTYEITFADWKNCVDDGVCSQMPDDLGWGRVSRPVIGVNLVDIKEFLAWLNKKSGAHYRLPTEAEWEYAARGGTQTQYWWGDNHEDGAATYCGSQWDTKSTVPVGSFPSNPFGLFDVHGNVWEMVEGCFNRQQDNGMCDPVIRGGSWQTYPLLLRTARRHPAKVDGRYSDVGFRVLRTLN